MQYVVKGLSNYEIRHHDSVTKHYRLRPECSKFGILDFQTIKDFVGFHYISDDLR